MSEWLIQVEKILILSSLLCDPEDRIGHIGGMMGSLEIKSHPFFHGVAWDQLRSISAPFEPKLNSNVDTTYFPIDDIDQADTSAFHRAQSKPMIDEHEAEMSLPFIGYTYKRFDAYK